MACSAHLPSLDDENRGIRQTLAETRSQSHAGRAASNDDLKEDDELESGKLPISTRIKAIDAYKVISLLGNSDGCGQWHQRCGQVGSKHAYEHARYK